MLIDNTFLPKCLILIVLGLFTLYCKKDLPQNNSKFNTLHVRLNREPDILNPLLNRTSISSTIQNLLFLPIMDFDPYTQAEMPVLATSNPIVLHNNKSVGYKIVLRPDATWDDGSSITALDVVFTIKAITNPFVQSGAQRSVIESIDSIELTSNPKELIFWTDDNYFLDEQSYTNNFILQEKVYDSLHLLEDISIAELRKLKIDDTSSPNAKKAHQFAAFISSPAFSREATNGSGPYRIHHWVTNQSLSLRKKQNWWGDTYKGTANNFNAYPDEIVFRFIPEEANAVLGLKEGKLDVITDISPAMFSNMKEDSTLTNSIQFLQGPPTRYVYFAMHTKSLLLEDVNTRKAMPHFIDLDQLKNSLFQGYADRINAPFLPSKAYYDHTLPDIPFDFNIGKKFLTDAGWKDSNNDGVLDKNNKQLKLRLFTTPGGLGQRIAQHFAENAKQAGVIIDIIPQTLPVILEQAHKHDFEFAALAEVQYNGPDDPYASWHSKNYFVDNQNITGFGSALSDTIIQQIRVSEPGVARNTLYKELQRIIYDQQPVLFLFAPQNLMAVSKKWQAKAASVRPGYFINDFRPLK